MDRVLARMCPRDGHTRGFTLMEVLVALAVLAIALTSIYKMQGRTIMMSSKARFLTVAPLLAQSKLAEIESSEFKDISNDSGVFGEAYPDYAWALSVEALPTELITDNNYHLVRIDVQISQGDEENFQLRTYRFFTDGS